MRNLITVIALAASLVLGWQYQELTAARTAADAKIAEMSEETEKLKASLKIANAKIVQLTGPARAGQAGPSGNWIAERNRNWKDPLSAGASNSGSGGRGTQRGAMTTPGPLAPQATTYYTDAQGRYWFDASGVKRYVQ